MKFVKGMLIGFSRYNNVMQWKHEYEQKKDDKKRQTIC